MSNRILTAPDGDYLVTTPGGDYIVYTDPQTAEMSVDFSHGEQSYADLACFLWLPQQYKQISLNLKNKSWTFQNHDEILLDWGNCPLVCGIWEDAEGDEIVLTVPSSNWIEKEGDEIILKYPECPPPVEGILETYISTGESLSASLHETFMCVFSSGEEIIADLDDNPAAYLETGISTGEEIICDLAMFRQLQTDISTGENLLGSLTSVGPINLASYLSQGENLEVDLATQMAIDVDFSNGEELIPDLQIYPVVTFDPEFYTGENLIAEMNETPKLQTEISTGESFDVDLSTQNTIVSFFFDGQAFECEFTDNPSAKLQTVMSTGEFVEVFPQFTQQLGVTEFFEGAQTDYDIDNLPNEYFHEGAQVDVDLSVLTNLGTVNFSEGQNIIVDLQENPQAALETYISEGAQVDCELDTTYGRLMSVYMMEGVLMTSDIDSSTHFDLTTTCCSGEELPLREPGVLDIEMINIWEEPASTYQHDAAKLVVDLFTNPRFSVDFAEGAAFSAKDYNVYMDVQFSQGESVQRTSLDGDFNFRLCYGNFSPSPDDFFIELGAIDPECYSETTILTGETLECDLSTTSQFESEFYTGEVLNQADMTFDGALVALFAGGSQLDVELKTYPLYTDMPSCYLSNGENLQSEMTISQDYTVMGIARFHQGENLILPESLTTDRRVAFLEGGCLPNEFMPQTPSGDPDLEKFNPVPVEFDRYRHEIKGRCE